ncbi:MAG: protein-glutamate O-methyltransferase CheR [Acidobacteria bacterium]|nr:protein-glutamate O-methyltransferase CheR [Acidobacteriota bacterium]MCI0627718.1 protein-glutamate O-methyltransferase CheR [Acidobacteriota bacterium]MCI0722429.1 protein-glutamate O-methyltransferase CheR [Acidobacteriota bacterium]
MNEFSRLEETEIYLLLEGIYRHYGFDFRNYAFASLRRRVWNVVRDEKLNSISALQERVLHDRTCLERFLLALSVHVSAMFRDPDFFRIFRAKAVPLLRTYPYIRIWLAGCSTGEEVYSIAILLQEEGLYERSRIYASDMNEAVLRAAKAGIYPLQLMRSYTANYIKAGGARSFSEYYTAAYDNALMRPSLLENVVFCQHNLATDGSFNEFNVILCRNVMIYFDKTLQERVHGLFYNSLVNFGLLGLGDKESLHLTAYEHSYEQLSDEEKLYRRIA